MKPSEHVSGGRFIQAIFRMAIAGIILAAINIAVCLSFRFESQLNNVLFGFCLLAIDVLILFLALKSAKQIVSPLLRDIDDSARLIEKISGAPSLPEDSLLERLEGLSNHVNETRQRERKIIDNAVDVICVMDVEAKFLSVSPSARKRWGYSEEELLGKKLTDFLVSEDSGQSLAAILGARASIDQISFENRLKHKQGELIDLSWTAHWSARDEGLFCVAHDISERKQAEAKIQESERRLRVTLEAMPVGVVCATQNGTIEFANESFGKFVGVEPSALVGSPLSQFSMDEEKEKLQSYLNEARSSGLPLKSIESVLRQEGDEDLPVDISVTTFKVSGVSKLLVSYSDISQRKEVENIRREFIAMINHDLRAPLTSLTMLVDLLKSGKHGELEPKGKEACNLASAEAERMMRLVNDLLDLEKIESGNLKIQHDMVCVLDIIEASVSSIKTYADSRNLKILYPETEADCWADRGRVIQVLVNLLSNAIKFSPPDSSIEISVSELTDCVKISITDQGRGIPADKAKDLFKRFAQVKIEDERSGSGLGLSICKAIIDAHNGSIGFVSNESPGSSFYFTLPHRHA